AATHDAGVRRIGARTLLLNVHRLGAGVGTMHRVAPIDIVQMAVVAGADEADRRDLALPPIVEFELPPASAVEIVPADEPATARGFGALADYHVLHRFADDPLGEHRRIDAGGPASLGIEFLWRRAQGEADPGPQPPLILQQFLQAARKPRL